MFDLLITCLVDYFIDSLRGCLIARIHDCAISYFSYCLIDYLVGRLIV